jgi:hypothetical protein
MASPIQSPKYKIGIVTWSLLSGSKQAMKLADLVEIERELFQSGQKIILTDSRQIADTLLNMNLPEDHPLFGALVFLVDDFTCGKSNKELH